MAAGASRTYKADFLIGARMLGSFKAVLASAQSRIKAVHASARRFATGFLSMAGKLAGVLGIFASFAAGKIFSSIFEDASKEAAAADQRSRKMAMLLMTHNTIRKKGLGFAQDQAKQIFEANEALSKQGVIGKELLDASSTQLAVYGYSPKAIAGMAAPMADVLAMSKGVSATEEDSTGLATAWGNAVKTGMTKGMKQYGFILSDTEQKQFKGLKNAEKRNAWILKWAQSYKGFNAELTKTPEGKIQQFHNQMKAFAVTIGKQILPAQAQMAQAWGEILPELEPIATGVFKAIVSGATALAGYVHTTLIPAFHRFIDFLKSGPVTKAAQAIWQNFKGALGKIGTAFKNMFKSLMPASAQKMSFGDIIIAAMNKLAAALKWVGDNASWLVPLITGLVVAFEAISIAITVTTAAIAVFNGVLAISPIGWVLIGIAALVAGLVYLHVKFGTLTNALTLLWEWLKKIPGLGPILEAFWTNLVKSWQELIATLSAIDWAGIWQGLIDAWHTVEDVFTAGWQIIKDAATAVGKAIYDAFMGPINAIKSGWQELTGIFSSTKKPDLAQYGPPQGAAPTPMAAYANATGGIIRRPQVSLVGEAGPEAIIPLSGGRRAEGLLNYANRAIGRGGGGAAGQTNVTFSPQVTINGNVGPAEQAALTTSLRQQAKEFIAQFKAAQTQERRLSYESGYA